MNSKIQSYHQQKMACITLRQSTMFQVLHNQEEYGQTICTRTESSAVRLGQNPDPDHGWGSGAIREPYYQPGGFQVPGGRSIHGERRRHLRPGSFTSFQEFCRLEPFTRTLLPHPNAHHRSGWLLRSQPVQRSASARFKGHHVSGGAASNKSPPPWSQMNKAKRGELRFPIPVGFVYDDEANISFDPDAQVCHVIRLLFDVF